MVNVEPVHGAPNSTIRNEGGAIAHGPASVAFAEECEELKLSSSV